MKILLLGMWGQVGWELRRSLSPLGGLVALGRAGTSQGRADFTRSDELADTVRCVAPQVIVNAAAYTAVDRAEAEPELARAINVEAVSVLAREAAAADAWLVHFSSDFVFDGSGSTPWREDAPTGPLNVYGHTKLDGEQAIRASGCKHLLLRTSWVHSPRGTNFARKLLRFAMEQSSIEVVDDQIGAPTGADLLADVTAHALRGAMAQPQLGGTYHVAAAGATSRYGYACQIVESARRAGRPLRLRVEGLKAVSSAAVAGASAARRPLNSRLDTGKLQQAFGLTLPDWRIGVERLLREALD